MRAWLSRSLQPIFWPSENVRVVCSVFVVAFLLSFTFYVAQVHRRDGLESPPRAEDAIDYDCIAVQLTQGNGFAVDYRDPQFQQPYLVAQRRGLDRPPLDDDVHGPTTLRPPGLPLLMAVVYETVGRRFEVLRLVNCASMALAVCLALVLAYRVAGIAGVAAGLFCATVADTARPYIMGEMLTEPIATLAVTGLFFCHLNFVHRPSRIQAALIGVVLGVATLYRTALLLWVPVLLLAILVPWTEALAGLSWRRRLAAVLIAVSSLTVCIAPWAVRNSLLLGRFKPLGLHGEINLAVAYSDLAMRNGGLWYSPLEKYASRVESMPVTAYQRELMLSELSRRDARSWISENWTSIPRLMVARVVTAWWANSRREILFLLFAMIGLLLYPDRDRRRLIIWYIAAVSFSIAITWSVGGRFTVPVRPLLYACAAVALALPAQYVIHWLSGNTSRTHTWRRAID